MKKYLLQENGNFYKANLHCHSIVSDGAFTPEELKNSEQQDLEQQAILPLPTLHLILEKTQK